MTNTQKNQFMMFESVLALLKANQDVTETIPAFTELIPKFETLVTQIRDKSRERDNLSIGKTATKSQLRNQLTDLLFVIISGLSVYAASTENTELRTKVKISKSRLTLKRDSELISFAHTIHELAVAYKTQLITYGITTDKITTLPDKIMAYQTAANVKENAAALRTSATASLVDLFTATNHVIHLQLDNLVNVLASSYPDFAYAYTSARGIKNYGTRRRKPTSETEDKTVTL